MLGIECLPPRQLAFRLALQVADVGETGATTVERAKAYYDHLYLKEEEDPMSEECCNSVPEEAQVDIKAERKETMKPPPQDEPVPSFARDPRKMRMPVEKLAQIQKEGGLGGPIGGKAIGPASGVVRSANAGGPGIAPAPASQMQLSVKQSLRLLERQAADRRDYPQASIMQLVSRYIDTIEDRMAALEGRVAELTSDCTGEDKASG